jgi:hypothetical protein
MWLSLSLQHFPLSVDNYVLKTACCYKIWKFVTVSTNPIIFNLQWAIQIPATCFLEVHRRSEEHIISVFRIQVHESSLKCVSNDVSKKHASFIIRVEK